MIKGGNMSHFSVAVVSKAPQDIEELLAPYQEGGIGECPSEYLSFYPDEDCDIDDITGKKRLLDKSKCSMGLV